MHAWKPHEPRAPLAPGVPAPLLDNATEVQGSGRAGFAGLLAAGPSGAGSASDRGAHILPPIIPFIPPIFFIIFMRPPPRIFFIMSRICSY